MKRLIGMLLPVLAACTLLAGCSVETQEEANDSGSNRYYFYYLNKEETKLVREEYTPDNESAEFMLQDITRRFNEQDAEGDSIALLPSEVQIGSYETTGSVLNLNFGSAYGNISRTREILVRAGVVRTFLQVPGITGVRFLVNGSDLLDSKGQLVGEMNSATFVEMWGDSSDTYRYDTFTLYFTDSTGENLVEEKRNVYYKRNLSREQVTLEQLIIGPMVREHYPTLSGNTEVLSVTTSDGICYVDLSRDFLDSASDIPENTVIYSVVNSLLTTADADRVQISVDGEAEATLGEDASLYNFYGWNEGLITPGGE